jgi:hypothetical protein
LTFDDLWNLPRPMLCQNILPKLKNLLELKVNDDLSCDLESKPFQNLLENQVKNAHSKVRDYEIKL